MEYAEWNKITTRFPTTEEREVYRNGFKVVYEGKFPKPEEDVLVFMDGDIYIDTWLEFDDEAGFKNTDEPIVYWMSLPEPPKN